jgi:FkbM family methyltransferase
MRVKAIAKTVLNKLVTRERFNDSRVYEAYLFLFLRSAFLSRRAEERFYSRLIECTRTLIFDIGANSGSKARIFAKLADRVICVEPTPGAIGVLRKRFRYNPTITIVPKGVGETEMTQHLHIFDDSGPYNTISQKMVETLCCAGPSYRLPRQLVKEVVEVQMTTLDHLIRDFGAPFYIKVDVEGYEQAVIRGLTRPVPLISFECNLPEFADEAEECVTHLAHLSPTARFNYAIEEPPSEFVSHEWLPAADIVHVARSGGLGYMEIFCASEVGTG